MAFSSRCLRYCTLFGDIIFMVCGLVTIGLQLARVIPLLALLPLPTFLFPPLLLPLLPACLSLPAGFLACRITRIEGQRWKLFLVFMVQAIISISFAVLAGWQIALSFSHRLGPDIQALMDSLYHPKQEAMWHNIHHQLACCGPDGLHALNVLGANRYPMACQVRYDSPLPSDAAGNMAVSSSVANRAEMYNRGCVGPATELIKGVLREGALLCAAVGIIQLVCAALSMFLVDDLRRAEKRRRDIEEMSLGDKPLRPDLNRRN